jgi:hypothetical protein
VARYSRGLDFEVVSLGVLYIYGWVFTEVGDAFDGRKRRGTCVSVSKVVSVGSCSGAWTIDPKTVCVIY